jgi:hypothetical protein
MSLGFRILGMCRGVECVECGCTVHSAGAARVLRAYAYAYHIYHRAHHINIHHRN